MIAVKRVGDHQPEHRVAEELQPLVMRGATVLVCVGPMRQGALQQLAVNSDSERIIEGGGVCRRPIHLAAHVPGVSR